MLTISQPCAIVYTFTMRCVYITGIFKERRFRLANRFQAKQHELAASFIDERDGHYCIVCQKVSNAKLQIDHANNDPQDWTPENLHWLCQKHNLEMRALTTKQKVALIRWYSANNMCVRENSRGHYSTGYLQSKVDYTKGSPEMQVNALAELSWREWVLEEIDNNGFILLDVAIDTGAELFGVSPASTQRYLRKLVHPRSKFEKAIDMLNARVIRPRPEK